MNHATFRVQCSEKVLIETSIRTRMSELFPKGSIRMFRVELFQKGSVRMLSECSVQNGVGRFIFTFSAPFQNDSIRFPGTV